MTATNRETLERRIRVLLADETLGALQTLLVAQHPADIADVIDRLDEEQRLRVFRLLAPAQAAEVLDETGVESTRDLFRLLPPGEASALLGRLPVDDVVEILSEDVPERQQALLGMMTPGDADEIRLLLQYPPQSAGRLMSERFVRVEPEMNGDELIALLRRLDPQIEQINDLYVLDDQHHLQGIVTLRDALTAPPTRLLRAAMRPPVVTVAPSTDQEEVARLIAQYDLTTLPVLAPDGHMLGIITVDDAIDVLVRENSEDVLRFGAVEGGGADDQPYFTMPITRAVRRRVGWLMLLFVAETATGSVLRLFESELAQVVALSFYIPLLIGTGGNTGAQTVSTLIRGLALGEIRLSDTWRVLVRELSSGVLLGLLLGTFGFARAMLWGSPATLAAVVGLTIVAICTWANTIGALIPLAARRLGVDPALVSAPLITTLVDATGLAIYLLIAKAILGL